MGSKQSNLSLPQYGYDVVVAISQASINVSMKEYLSETAMSVVTVYYTIDTEGNLLATDYETLRKQTNDTNPLKVGSWDNSKTSTREIENLAKSNFRYALQVKVGLPKCFDDDSVPDIVKIIPNNLSVIFSLLCSTLTIVAADVKNGEMITFINQSQPEDSAWIFTSNVSFQKNIDNSNLPASVQQQADKFGGDFSVQKLMLDLDKEHIHLVSSPTIPGIVKDSPADVFLKQAILDVYFDALKSKLELVLNYTIIPTANLSSLKITDTTVSVNAFVDGNGKPIPDPTQDQQDIMTLNYLCSVNGNKLPHANPFSWNWLENVPEDTSAHGIIVIKRAAIVAYFKNLLDSLFAKKCLDMFITGHNTSEWLVQSRFQDCTIIDTPGEGKTVLNYSSYSVDSDLYGAGGFLGEIFVNAHQDITAEFVANKIIIRQSLRIYLRIRSVYTVAEGYIVDKTITDTYTMATDASGKLLFQSDFSSTDNSQKPKVNGFLNFFSGVNKLVDQAETWTNGVVSTNFKDIPVSLMSGFIFPAGKTFVFKDAFFSDHQDLITRITYEDQS